MPTGYTAPILENPDYTFEEFAWNCAKGCFPLVGLMRFFPLGTKIPKRFETDPDYYTHLARAEAELERKISMSDEEWQKLLDENTETVEELPKKSAEEMARCDAMIEKVRAWVPPTESHGRLKEFMLKQLNDIQWDIHGQSAPPRKTLEEFKSEELQFARGLVFSAKNELEAQNRLTAQRNEWIAKLRESIPIPSHFDGEIE